MGRPGAIDNAYEFARWDSFCGADSVTEFVAFSKTPLAIVFCSQVCRDGRRGRSGRYRATSPGSRAEVQRWPARVCHL
jgi:hypothetical protein